MGWVVHSCHIKTLVVILVINQYGIRSFERKHHAPIAVNRCWSKLLEITRTVASKPGPASVEMFSHLCLNAALSNTDDHLKNFGFLKSSTDALHYDIAPVFDVSPQASDMHYLHCGNLGQRYSLKDCIGQARMLGIASGAATEIHDRIMAVLDRRDDYFDMAKLSNKEKTQAGNWVARGAGQNEFSRL